ncbi:MAG TPA: hypothetical protein DCE42_17980 [Myxococcales bacterium]|nr:hypothetical protein [Deltaproteobacteria bacterium]MBU49034.1 hypothetical protein [Deltaproteobacteria bacterium]HAA56659.1 hypothetical protein [Myxococcales bacterium]
MSVFKRISRLFKSYLNAWISKAEDPEKILEQVVIDMRQQLRDAQQRVASAIADEKRLQKQMMEAEKQSASWEKKAMRAVQLDNDDLAREALKRKAQYDELASEYRKQWGLQKAAVEHLKTSLHELNQKIEEAARQKEILIARKKRAEAQKMIQDTMVGMSDNSAFETLERMSKRVDGMEAEAEAYNEVSAEIKEQTLEERFRQLEDEQPAEQDEALAALKARMNAVETQQNKETVKQAELEKIPVLQED